MTGCRLRGVLQQGSMHCFVSCSDIAVPVQYNPSLWDCPVSGAACHQHHWSTDPQVQEVWWHIWTINTHHSQTQRSVCSKPTVGLAPCQCSVILVAYQLTTTWLHQLHQLLAVVQMLFYAVWFRICINWRYTTNTALLKCLSQHTHTSTT